MSIRQEMHVTRVSEYYGIEGPLPFVNVRVSADLRLGVNPQAIRLARSPQPFADEAIECLDSFWNEIVTRLRGGSDVEIAEAGTMLSALNEPRETRLGVTQEGIAGRGAGPIIARRIIESLNSEGSELLHAGILDQIDLLPLFVRGIGFDIMSDITTRIIFAALGHFTAKMVETYPQLSSFGHEMMTIQRQIWNPVALEWEESEMAVPVAGGEPLLMVPREWANSYPLMSMEGLYYSSVLEFAQQEQTESLPGGVFRKPKKKDLEKQPSLRRSHATNIRVVSRALDASRNLVDDYRDSVAGKWSERHHLPAE